MPTPARTLKSEADLCTWILAETRRTTSCQGLDVRFALVRRHPRNDDQPSWDLRAVSGWGGWPHECRLAFLSAVNAAQERFDLLFGPADQRPTFPADPREESAPLDDK